MGLSIDKEQFDEADHVRFAERLQQSLEVLGKILDMQGFGDGQTTFGAELELCIIDPQAAAYPINRELLSASADSPLSLELDRFNIEYNSSPVSLSGEPFRLMESELTQAIRHLNRLAGGQGGRIVPIGILPTLTEKDLQGSAMTDLPRYRALSAAIKQSRLRPFEVCIFGEDPLNITCDDVTLEGANTSFQVHLRVPPGKFASLYNAAQMVTPIAVALGANSPLFLGHRLWDETRVALFKQAIDSRPAMDADWIQPARVSYGHGWVREGAYELFAEAVGLFPPLLPVVGKQLPQDCFRRGELPRLDELRLHQGTVWRWNRAVYDPGMGGHLRIEMRALPSGPTPIDMVASAAFLIGMVLGLGESIESLLPYFPFHFSERNFYRAAQQGIDAKLLWPSTLPPSPKERPVCELAKEMLPVAQRGLEESGVEDKEINRMLDVIQDRIETRLTGARWQRRILAQLERRMSRPEALPVLVEMYLAEAQSGCPVSTWRKSI